MTIGGCGFDELAMGAAKVAMMSRAFPPSATAGQEFLGIEVDEVSADSLSYDPKARVGHAT